MFNFGPSIRLNTQIDCCSFITGQWNSVALRSIQPYIFDPNSREIITAAMCALIVAGADRSITDNLTQDIVILNYTANTNRLFWLGAVVTSIGLGCLFHGIVTAAATAPGSMDRIIAAGALVYGIIGIGLLSVTLNFNSIWAHCNAANSIVSSLKNSPIGTREIFARALEHPSLDNNVEAKKILKVFQTIIPQ